ncbi:uncharacterized protein LOC126834838 [Adelges cooleyi]|uniref:uncharacterized protein LOC126834838 n=1 Tax=Adelges cooleyi TaxID=133065 RepID=UPI00217F43FD|nr:uncharacterized protein LOC126834838 [Adelges cooleyi]
MSADRQPCGSSSRDTDRQSQPWDQKLSSATEKKSITNLLYDYLFLELGTNKKEAFNHVHLGQSMRFANRNTSMKLLNTVAHAKAINFNFEAELLLESLNDKDDRTVEIVDDEHQDDSKEDDGLLPMTAVSSQLEDSNFKSQYFVSRSSFYIIIEHLMKEFGGAAYKRTQWDVEKQLMVALTYLGTVQSYKEISTKFNIAVSTAHKCVNDITNSLFKHMNELIYWPVDQQADSEILAFDQLPGNKFPGILGVIGTVDLRKTCTSNPSKHTKDRTSIAIQCVCNTKYQFYNVFTSYLFKSKVTTSTFLESPLAESILNEPDTLFPNGDTHIVGASCYPLLPNLMKPFFNKSPDDPLESNYNDSIEGPLKIIQLAFGKLLGRFKRLLCLDLWGQEKFAILIFAACCLHNICLGNDDDIESEPYECCSFNCDYYDEISIKKRQDICKRLS